ncbi:mRNA stability protein [Fusarium oxysporum f. sp. albedinis]|nr:mRNA stability protein [Fusarium oxysporum f. sp. albedinis]
MGLGARIRYRKRRFWSPILALQRLSRKESYDHSYVRRCFYEPSKRSYGRCPPHQSRRAYVTAEEEATHSLRHG